MLYNDGPVWVMALKEKAITEGRQEGLQEGRKAGLREGRQEGLQEGRKEGRNEERKAIFNELLATLKAKLAERFGHLPELWLAPLASLSEPDRIMELMGVAYTASSAAEFEEKLLQMRCGRE